VKVASDVAARRASNVDFFVLGTIVESDPRLVVTQFNIYSAISREGRSPVNDISLFGVFVEDIGSSSREIVDDRGHPSSFILFRSPIGLQLLSFILSFLYAEVCGRLFVVVVDFAMDVRR